MCVCVSLIAALAHTRAGEPERWLASVCLKSAVARRWRAAPGRAPVSDKEKARLRPLLLAALAAERDARVGVQLAVVVAKVARLDFFAGEWPTLLTELLAHIGAAGDAGGEVNAPLAMHHVLKELASKRLAADRRNFQQAAAQCIEPLWAAWGAESAHIAQGVPAALAQQTSAHGAALARLERWLLLLKCLRRLAVHGFEADARSAEEVPFVGRLVPACMSGLGQLRAWRDAAVVSDQDSPLACALERCALKAMKTAVDLQKVHPWSFRGCLGAVVDACVAEVRTAAPGSARGVAAPQCPRFERLLIHCMVFIQQVLKCKPYRKALEGAQPDGPATRAAALAAMTGEVRASLAPRLGEDALEGLCRLLVCDYLPLGEDELTDWQLDAEAWQQQQEVVGSKDKLRPCAESLYATALETCPARCAPAVASMLQEAHQALAAAGSDAQAQQAAALNVEAAWNAIGLGEYSLYDHVDFRALFAQALLPELGRREAWRRPTRRRAAWVLGRWVSSLDASMREAAYGALIALLEGEPDLAVRLVTLGALHALCDDWSFEEETFAPHLSRALNACFALCGASAELDTHTRVFALVGVLVERMPANAPSAAEHIAAQLPGAWAASEAQALLRIQVVTVVQKLVSALGLQGGPLHEMIGPVLAYATDPDQREALSLLEDGLQLWLAVLRNAPAMTPELMTLFANVPKILSGGFEHLAACVRLLEAYVLLGGADFLSAHGASVVFALQTTVGNVREEGMLLVLRAVEMILVLFPTEAPALLEALLARMAATVALTTRGGGACKGGDLDEPPRVVAEACYVLARVLFTNAAAFQALLAPGGRAAAVLAGIAGGAEATAPAGGGLAGAVAEGIIEASPTFASVQKRKVCALALCVLLTSADQSLALEHLEGVARVAAAAAIELTASHEADGGGGMLGRQWERSGVADEDDLDAGEGEAARLRAAYAADRAVCANLSAALRDALAAAERTHGSAALSAAAGALPPEVRAQLEKALALAAAPTNGA